MILHICPRAAWESARAAGVYEADSLATQGYIHCSTGAQVRGPATLLFRGRTDLLVLEIDESRLPVPVTWEQGDGEPVGSDPFPHVYSAIPVAAVVAVHEYLPLPDGTFGPFDAGGR